MRGREGGSGICQDFCKSHPLFSRAQWGGCHTSAPNYHCLVTVPKTNFPTQFSSVAQSCLTLCDPMDCSTPGLPVHYQPPGAYSNSCPIELVIPSNHLILCFPLLLLPSIFPSIRVFSDESALRIRWPKYWGFSFNISPSNEYSGLISFRMDGWISFQSKGLSRVFSNTTVQKHQFFGAQFPLSSNSHIHT